MISKNKAITFGISALIALNIVVSNFPIQSAYAEEDITNYKSVNPLELVANPQTYLNNKVKISATFDKFSTLGLDYKPAFKDSKNYISFLIKRVDSSTDHNIPLSELKLIINRDKAEKLADLESGDQIEFTGNVFSAALNDPWIEVENIKVISSKVKNVSDKKAVTEDNKKTSTSTTKKAPTETPAKNKPNKK